MVAGMAIGLAGANLLSSYLARRGSGGGDSQQAMFDILGSRDSARMFGQNSYYAGQPYFMSNLQMGSILPGLMKNLYGESYSDEELDKMFPGKDEVVPWAQAPDRRQLTQNLSPYEIMARETFDRQIGAQQDPNTGQWSTSGKTPFSNRAQGLNDLFMSMNMGTGYNPFTQQMNNLDTRGQGGTTGMMPGMRDTPYTYAQGGKTLPAQGGGGYTQSVMKYDSAGNPVYGGGGSTRGAQGGGNQRRQDAQARFMQSQGYTGGSKRARNTLIGGGGGDAQAMYAQSQGYTGGSKRAPTDPRFRQNQGFQPNRRSQMSGDGNNLDMLTGGRLPSARDIPQFKLPASYSPGKFNLPSGGVPKTTMAGLEDMLSGGGVASKRLRDLISGDVSQITDPGAVQAFKQSQLEQFEASTDKDRNKLTEQMNLTGGLRSTAGSDQFREFAETTGREKRGMMTGIDYDQLKRMQDFQNQSLARSMQALGMGGQFSQYDIGAGLQGRGQDINAMLQSRGQDIGAGIQGRGQDINAMLGSRGQDISTYGMDINAMLAQGGLGLQAGGLLNQQNQTRNQLINMLGGLSERSMASDWQAQNENLNRMGQFGAQGRGISQQIGAETDPYTNYWNDINQMMQFSGQMGGRNLVPLAQSGMQAGQANQAMMNQNWGQVGRAGMNAWNDYNTPSSVQIPAIDTDYNIPPQGYMQA